MNECKECGSERIIKDAMAIDRADYNQNLGFQLAVQEDPNALIFKGSIYSQTTADVCADCGLISFYAVAPEELWTAYQNRLRKQG